MTTESVWSPESALPEDLAHYIAKLDSSSNPNLYLFAFLRIIHRLKATPRTGWLNYDVKQPESIADHMYRMGIIAMLSNRKDIDLSHCVKIALVHDMAESLVGDITPFDPVKKEEKHRREYETMIYISNLLKPFNSRAAQELLDLWNEYENISSPEARFVKDVDKFELMVQTVDFETRDHFQTDLGQFMGVQAQIKTDEVIEWAKDLNEERQRLKKEADKEDSTN